jgi:hypothetical protein
MEQLAQSSRHNGSPNVACFNRFFAGGWNQFLEEERADMISTDCNNTTNAIDILVLLNLQIRYVLHGVCGVKQLRHLSMLPRTTDSNSVQSCGQTVNIRYELSQEDKKLLKKDWNWKMTQQMTWATIIVMIRGDKILREKWRERMETGVRRKGGDYELYAATLSPEYVVTPQIHKTAMKNESCLL